jgi:AsmA protein
MDDFAPSPPPRRQIPPILYILAGVALLLATAAAMAPWAFSNAALRTEIAAQIRHLTGLAASSQGRAVFVVLPQPHISVEDVSFADPTGALRIDARYFKGYLRLVSLFTGQIEIASATLDKPNIDFNLDGRPKTSNSVIGRAAEAVPATAEAASADAARLGTVRLIDGNARLKGSQLSSDLSIDAINMTMDWPKPGAAAILAGHVSTRGETAAVNAWIANPAALLRGQRSPLSLKIDAPSVSLSADGGLASMPKWQFNGRLHTAAPSLRVLLEQAGYFVPLPGSFNGLNVSCDANVEAASAIFSSLRLRLDGDDFEGTLAFQTRAKTPVLSGTLATTHLSLRDIISSLPATAGRDGQWNRDPFDLQKYGPIDLDLRLSAAHVLFSRFEIEDAAFSLMRNGGRAELTLAGAKAYQGTTKGRVTFDFRDNGVGVQASGVISGADLAAMSYDAFGWPEFYGSLTGTANLVSTGASIRELMHNLNGLARIDIGHGQLGGIDLISALRQIDTSPLALLADIRHGRTAFDHAGFGLRFVNGVASIDDGKLENPGLQVAFGGTVDFGERGLDLHAAAMSPITEVKAGKEISDFRFDIGGSWDNLVFTPDVRGLIRRSGAAAPLFPQRPDAASQLDRGGIGGQ